MRTRHTMLSFVLLMSMVSITRAQAPVVRSVDPTMARDTHARAEHSALIEVNRGLDEAISDADTSRVDAGWWREFVHMPIREGLEPLEIKLEDLLFRTLTHSKQVKVFSELPLIRETAIGEADAAFDWYGFLDTQWDDVSDPVGSTLTVGGLGRRFNDHNWSGSAGIRRKTTTGAQLEAAQRFGWQDNNSTFFLPDPQGTSRLTVSLTQPLLRGRGRVYNTSLTVLAQIDRSVADDEFRRQLETHLLEVTRGYWSLYLERAVLYQKLESYRRAAGVTQELEYRRDVDASKSQLETGRAAMAQRRSDLFRARAAVKNAEAKIRALVNDPGLADFDTVELLPGDAPALIDYPVDIHEALATALQSRPEVLQAIKQTKSACVRLNMSKHELLPVLNLVMKTYASGLEDRGQVPESWVRQFDTGAPSYGVGLQYEVPFGNRAASFRHRRRRHEVRQLEYQYEMTMETVKLEVEVAVRELETSRQEMSAKHDALVARQRQLETLVQRWKRLSGENVTASLALENLLLAQDRLADAESQYLQSQLTYNLSITNIQRATGTLLRSENISVGQGCECNLPTQYLDKAAREESDINTDHAVELRSTQTGDSFANSSSIP